MLYSVIVDHNTYTRSQEWFQLFNVINYTTSTNSTGLTVINFGYRPYHIMYLASFAHLGAKNYP